MTMGLINDYKLYRSYCDIIKTNKVALEGNYNIRIDGADRIYTVINIPQSEGDESYNLRKQDIDRLAETHIREYINNLSTFLNSIGLSELYTFYDPPKKVDKHSYLLVLGFNRFNTVSWNRFIYFRLWPIVGLLLLTSLLFYFS